MSYAFLMIFIPLLSSVLLLLLSDKLSLRVASVVSAIGLGFGFLAGLFTNLDFQQQPDFQAGSYLHQTLWTWVQTPLLSNEAYFFGLRLDALSFALTLTVLLIGFLLSVYLGWFFSSRDDSTEDAVSAQATQADEHLNQHGMLFGMAGVLVCAVLLVVLADNILLFLLGWFGVTASAVALLFTSVNFRVLSERASLQRFSYWKASLIWLLVADALMLLAALFLYYRLGSLDISTIIARLPELYPQVSLTDSRDSTISLNLAVRVMVALFLVSCLGKMALLPWQGWLTNAVRPQATLPSRLPVVMWILCIATIVPALYLMVRFYAVFGISVDLMMFFGVVGVVSALLFALTALAKRELSQVILYISLSQLGLLAVTLSTASWQAAVVHAMTLMVALALLWMVFASLVNVVYAPADRSIEIDKTTFDLSQMKTLYVAAWIAISGLCALPWLSGRFFSQYDVFWELWITDRYALYGATFLVHTMTALVLGRLMYLLFHRTTQDSGNSHEQDIDKVLTSHHYKRLSGIALYAPLLVLMLLATPLSYMLVPNFLQTIPLSVGQLLLIQSPDAHRFTYHAVAYASMAAVLIGFFVAFYYYRVNAKQRRQHIDQSHSKVAWTDTKVMQFVDDWFDSNYGLDAAYRVFLYQPYCWVARHMQSDIASQWATVLQWLVNHTQRLTVILSQKPSVSTLWQDRTLNPLFSVALLAVCVFILRVL